MNAILISCCLVLVVIAAIVTVRALKQEERKLKRYESQTFPHKDAIRRSKHYEENSVSTMLPIQIWSYVAGFIVIALLITLFALFY
ncbi:hypothetical protein SPD48_19340 [Pseudogracilibacillus sp. SE30717A]|uniref:hypothetical protein n=1 Tax=Pseudogracilibacillus sp. SE30717A TaxID=3098293 RepID=UPI00300E3510